MMPPIIRSKLFVPATRPELFAKALACEADAVSFDLEDAVPESRKSEARRTIGEFLHGAESSISRECIIVRVNATGSGHIGGDLEAIVWPGLDIVNLPKTESADEVRSMADQLAHLENARGLMAPIRILATIETPRGLRQAAEIAIADHRVMGLQLGFGDLFGPFGIDGSDERTRHLVRLALRFAAGEAGVAAYDGAYADISDPAGYRLEAEAAQRLGYEGKTCIHPTQVALANAAFSPDPEAIRFALKVIGEGRAAEADGKWAFVVDGRMVDGPGLRRAAATLELARHLGLVAPEQ